MDSDQTAPSDQTESSFGADAPHQPRPHPPQKIHFRMLRLNEMIKNLNKEHVIFFRCRQHLLSLLQVQGHWFFAQDVLSGIHQFNAQFSMIEVDGGYKHDL